MVEITTFLKIEAFLRRDGNPSNTSGPTDRSSSQNNRNRQVTTQDCKMTNAQFSSYHLSKQAFLNFSKDEAAS